MATHYLYRIQPTRDGFLTTSTPEEDAVVGDHFRYLKDLTDQGIVLLAGRTLNTDASSHGIVLFTADSPEHAQVLMENDPAVVAGVFRAELFSFSVALASEKILH